MSKAFELENFDKSVKPQDDFNLFVNGNWMKNNPIPEKYTRWGTFEILHEENLKKLHEIIKNSQNEYEILKVVYDAVMDEDRLNCSDTLPVQKYLDLIDKCENKDDLWKLLSNFYKIGLLAFFHVYPGEDAKDSKLVVVNTATSGLGLPDRSYYFDEDKEETRELYKKYLLDMWELYHSNKDFDVEKLWELEKSLAESTFTRVEKRDPDLQYNKMTVNELKETTGLDWTIFLGNLTKKEIPYIIVDNPNFYKKLNTIWNDTDLSSFKNIFKLKVISACSTYLSKRFVDLRFDFYKKHLSGQKEQKPQWEKAVAVVNDLVGELLGKKYVEIHFPQESKVKMQDMINRLQLVLKERIVNLTWMSEETKKKALKKHAAFKAKIGYPDKWRNYSGLKLNKGLYLLDMIIKSNLFEFEYEFSKIFTPTDPDKWEMNPHTINAYFHPLKNEIVFPAGILQPPFFNPKADDAVNYGSIGTVIGHEMTHSYDDMGSKFDEEGNLKNWWTDEDKKLFSEKSKYYDDEYSKFTVNGKNVNGKLTLGENLADHGGVKISYYALKNKLAEISGIDLINPKTEQIIDGFTQEQRFFISWANSWRANIRPEEADRRIITDPHSPNQWRVNGTLANIPEFHEVFNIKEGNMYRENPVQIW